MSEDLEQYPDEDLWEDGELTMSQVEKKIIQLWRLGKIIIYRSKDEE